MVDTEQYLADKKTALLKKVAERQVAKSEKLKQKAEAEGKTPEKTVVKKLNKLQKAIQISKAKKEMNEK